MVCRIEGNKRYKHFTYFRHFTLCVIFHISLLQKSHGVHLSKTISFTALDLAKSAGMDDEDISAAAIFDGNGSEEQGEVEGEELRGGGSERKVNLEESPLVDNVETPLDPVLPLCCSTETDDVEYIQCGGGVISSNENVNNGGFQTRTWSAPYNLVSTKFPAEFRLEKSVLKCESATFSASISLNENSTEGHFFYPDGTLKFENHFYTTREFCVRSIRKEKLSLQICQANCSNPLTPCIQKCCGLDEIYSFGSDDYATGCQPVSGDGGSSSASAPTRDIKWSPILYHNLSAKLTRREVSLLRPHYIQKYPSSFKHKCKSQKTTVFPFGTGVSNYLTMVTGKSFKNLEFRLRKDGWLLYPFRDIRGNEIPVINRLQAYCLDGADHYGEAEDYANHENQMVLFLCSGGVQEAFENSIIAPDSDEVTVNVPPSATTNTSNTSSSHAENNAQASGEGATTNIASSSALSQLSSNNNFRDAADSFFDKAQNGSGGSNDPSSAEIYLNTKARPHILYQLFQLNSHPRAHPTIFENHGVKKLTTIKKRRPTMTLFPSHPNRTKIVVRKKIKKPKFTLPVCCVFPGDVNDDGTTHHCRNRMVVFAAKPEKFRNSSIPFKPIWKVPGYFMTNGHDTQFALETKPPKCGFGQYQLQGFIHNFQQNASIQPEGVIESGILSDGSYLKYLGEFYRPDEFCINGLSPRIIEVLICKPNCKSKDTPCIPKCCGMDEAYSLGMTTGFRGCSSLPEDESKFRPNLFRNMDYPLTIQDQEKINPHFIQRYPPSFQPLCFKKITLAFPFSETVAARLNPTEESEKGPTFKSLQFRFRSDGMLMYSVPDEDGTSITAIYDRKEYCVDLIMDYGPSVNLEHRQILFICASQPDPQDENYR